MALVELMEKVAHAGSRIKLTDTNGNIYEGEACCFTSADDEENGVASVCIDTDDGGFGFFESDIKSIEEVA